MVYQEAIQWLDQQFDVNLPFVMYRKPGSTVMHCFFQETDALHLTVDYTESGFVFAPFDASKMDAILIPSEHQFSFEYKGTLENSNSEIVLNQSAGDRLRHLAIVQKGIDTIKNTRMKKVVLSRKHTISNYQGNPISIFERLLSKYKNAFVYCWYHPKVGLWLGATPETLLSIQNRRLKTMALAGTQKYQGTIDVKWGAKEKEEQQFVTDSIVENLNPFLTNLTVNDVQTHQAGSLLHLKTEIAGAFNQNSSPLKSVVNALHPTPAVCGLPKDDAKKFIIDNEQYDRKFYTGFLGELHLKTERKRATSRRNVENLAYVTIQRHTDLFVNLRCMEMDARGANLYVGGGITKDSSPEAEWKETVHKLETVSSVL